MLAAALLENRKTGANGIALRGGGLPVADCLEQTWTWRDGTAGERGQRSVWKAGRF